MTETSMSAPAQTDREKHRALMAELRARYLETERDDDLDEAIEDLVEIAERKGSEKRGLVLTGESGAGKSRALERVFSTNPAFQASSDDTMPLVSVTVPSPCTLMQLGRVVIKALGYPIVGEKTRHRIWEMVREKLAANHVKYLHLDEIQHLTENVATPEATMLRDTLKTFLNDKANGVCLILSGLPSVVGFLNEDRQVSRRCAFKRFPPLAPASALDVHTTAAMFAELAGLEIEPHSERALGLRLAHAACYQLGLAVEITIDAIERALRTNENLTHRHFAAEYHRRSGCEEAANPFLAPDFLDIDCAKVMQKDPYSSNEPLDQKPPQNKKRGTRRPKNRDYDEEA